jgi:hypothetical protein
MSEYGNSEYNEGLVTQIKALVETPIEALSDQDSTEEMQEYRLSEQFRYFSV